MNSLIHIKLNIKLHQYARIILLPLMVLTEILSSTIFNTLHHFFEIILFLILLPLTLTFKLTKEEVILCLLFIFSQIGSFLINDVSIFILNFKQYGLAILSIIYFQHNNKKSMFINFIALFCCVIILYEYTFGKYPVNLTAYLDTMGEKLGSRPIGLFLNYHLSSCFLAIFFLSYSFPWKLLIFDYLILFMINVKTNLLGFIVQKLYNHDFIKTKVIIFLSFFFLITLFIFKNSVLNLYLIYGDVSGYIILKQILDPITYTHGIFIFPQDVIKFLNNNEIYDYPELNNIQVVSSELSIVRIFLQGGFFLATFYLIHFFKKFKKFKLFILISLFHYTFIFTPLIIFLMSSSNSRSKNN